MNLRIEKVISELPAVLTQNTIYLVRTGPGFAMRVTDSTGAVAHSLNIEGYAIHIGTTAPASPVTGALWLDTSTPA